MLFHCCKVSMRYDHHVAVQDLDFSVEQGDYLCIVGENGSGNSTLINGILGLMPLCGGQIIWNMPRKAIGYLPQQTVVQRDFPACVYEVVLSGCLSRGGFSPFYSKQDKARADDALHRLDITNLKRKSYRELSGGQQQRVLLARALCAADRLLLLDEPVAGLDPVASAEMYRVVKNLNKSGMTIIMVSHDMNAAIQNATKILHMDRSAVFFGTTEQYLHSAAAGRMVGGKSNE